MSVDTNNNPVSGASFTNNFYINGVYTNSIVPSISLATASAGTFSISWSASTIGFHQLYAKNNITNVIYISDIYNVKLDSEVDPSPVIYVGL